MRFFDTNILLYSISTDPLERSKREIAIALLEGGDAALSVQVLQEFYVQATRLTKPYPLSHADAVDMIAGWSRFHVQDLTLAVLEEALAIRARYRFSYWDCAIIAAAQALGCRELYTEDMSHGQDVDGVLIINPFR
ncbi:MAG: PIN domain-containing protein [Bradyrhizobium sp.]